MGTLLDCDLPGSRFSYGSKSTATLTGWLNGQEQYHTSFNSMPDLSIKRRPVLVSLFISSTLGSDSKGLNNGHILTSSFRNGLLSKYLAPFKATKMSRFVLRKSVIQFVGKSTYRNSISNHVNQDFWCWVCDYDLCHH